MNYRQLLLTVVFSVVAAASLYPEGAFSRPLASLTVSDALRLVAVALLGIVAIYCFAVGIYMRTERKYWKLIEAQIQKSNSERKEQYKLRGTNR
jgi:hypothetical protein